MNISLDRRSRTGRRGAAVAFAVVLLGAASAAAAETPAPTPANDTPRARAARLVYEAAVADPSYQPAFDAFKASLPDDGRGNFIVEGDILITEPELRTYLEDLGKQQKTDGGKRAVELILATKDGQASFWPSGKRTLTYWVDRASFRTQAEADLTAAAVNDAATDWEQKCPECGIDFRALPEQEKDDAVFVVTYVPGSRPIARAFFPYTAPSARKVEVFDPFFEPDLGFDRKGVLRHELGHTLGYRHEHTRRVNGCFFEDDKWLVLTPYDSRSVMHYLCGGVGNAALEITEVDKKGHHCVYVKGGPPCPP